MIDSMVTNNNGGDVVMCDNASLCVEEIKEQMNRDVVAKINAAVNDIELSAESTNGASDAMTESSTPITRSPCCRRKRGAFGLFMAAFLSLNGSHNTKQKTDDATTPRKKKAGGEDHETPPATSWKSIVDGMRPLRLPGQELEYYPPPPPPPPPAGPADVYHNVLLAPPSSMRSGSEGGGMTSRYASAQDLHLLGCGEQEGDEEASPAEDDGAFGDSCPHAIDMQAEEFIAKFYVQFKSESFNGRATQ